ncbi:GNAT family N-acetyltransferase [Burkholderia contaminans]|uniref:GNAT family N-acetyltransferase n=1 Tax=Burkholderia contaminans TaxID=488447 RepID=UPI001CF3C4B2|nr:GNAT family N-acetyltransferase [Burkholderia contaminans]MCA7918997.1 GNAT family N-acetyltransferase [Burkholderia contaminans]UUX38349.1 GNAT family N-acetyltransferase [Burkholderia contaminans]
MEEQIQFAPATSRDLEFSWQSWSEAVKPHVAPFLKENLKRDWSEDGEFVRFQQWWTPERALVSLVGTERVGWCAFEENGESVVIRNFCIATEFRHRGYGSKALSKLLSEVLPQGKPIVHSILKDKGLVEFFNKFGFKQIFEDDLIFLLQKTQIHTEAP